MLTTDQKGALAEAKIAAAAIELGIDVFRPLSEERVTTSSSIWVTSSFAFSARAAVLHGDVLAVPWYSARRNRDGFVKRPYTAGEIDVVAAYSPDLGQCFLLPIERFGTRTYVQLRLAPSRNNQRQGSTGLTTSSSALH